MTEPIVAEGEGSAPVRAPRDSLFLHAQIHPIDGGPDIQVRVRNLSSGGMMAEPSVEIAPGERVIVDLRGNGDVGSGRPRRPRVRPRDRSAQGAHSDRRSNDDQPAAVRAAIATARPQDPVMTSKRARQAIARSATGATALP